MHAYRQGFYFTGIRDIYKIAIFWYYLFEDTKKWFFYIIMPIALTKDNKGEFISCEIA